MTTKLLAAAALAAVLLSGCGTGDHGDATSTTASTAAGARVVSSLKKTGKGSTQYITYDLNSSDVPIESDPLLNSMVQYLKSNPTVHLAIQSAANNSAETLNPKLSQDRTNALKSYLVAAGIDANRLDAQN